METRITSVIHILGQSFPVERIRLTNKESCLRDHALYGPGANINTGPLQQFKFSQFGSFLPYLLGFHIDHCHLLIYDFDKECSNFEYHMIGSKAGRCVLFELKVMMVLYLKKNEGFA